MQSTRAKQATLARVRHALPLASSNVVISKRYGLCEYVYVFRRYGLL